MNFVDHLWNHPLADGAFDLDAAEQDRAMEITANPQEITKLAEKAAKQERASWMNQQTVALRKQFAQPALSPELEPDVLVPLGNGTVVRLGDMNHGRIAIRRAMRRRAHDDERRAFAAEIAFWERIELLPKRGETIDGAIARGEPVPA